MSIIKDYKDLPNESILIIDHSLQNYSYENGQQNRDRGEGRFNERVKRNITRKKH